MVQKKQRYTKVALYEAKRGEVKKVVLLYSGSFETSILLKWIQEEYKTEVVALTIDIGQITDNLEDIKQRAITLGATQAFVIDAKDEFAEEYIAKGIKANASYQGGYHLALPLGRPLLAKWAVKIAAKIGADAIAHGSTGKGNDLLIEGTALALNPDIRILAPMREWQLTENEKYTYAKKQGIEEAHVTDNTYSYNDNMWGITNENEAMENPALALAMENLLKITTPPQKAPNEEELVELEFVKGIPVALNGTPMKLTDIILQLNTTGGKHGIGIVHPIEDSVIGLKVRRLYEGPAARIIITAHKNLERFVSSRLENEFKKIVDIKWAYLCYGALWYEPLMNDLNVFIDSINQKVTGKVHIRLYKGICEPLTVETPNTIFGEKLATFMTSSTMDFNQNASAGFIELYTLPMKLAQRAKKTALISVGTRNNKRKLLNTIKKLHDMHYQLYATYKTHKFLKTNGIETILVNKISQPQLKPNLAELLDANRFDLIINIPLEKEVTQADGEIIRQKAITYNVPIFTSIQLAQKFIEKLQATKPT